MSIRQHIVYVDDPLQVRVRWFARGRLRSGRIDLAFALPILE